MGIDTREEGLRRLKNNSLVALGQATSRLDNYYVAVSAGRTNDSTQLLHEVRAIRNAIDDYRNASETYVGYLEEQVMTYRNRGLV